MKILLKIAVLTLALLPAAGTFAQHTYTVRETGKGTTQTASRLTSKKIVTGSGDSVKAKTHNAPNLTPANLWKQMDSHGILNRFELAGNVGTTGLGIEVASPVTKWAKVRAGVDWMPRIPIGMDFSLVTYLDGQVSNKFNRIKELMYNYTGMEMDNLVEMTSKPTMTTFKLLVDVYPFQQNKHWHITAGFFVGGRTFGTSINKMQEMPSLLTLNMYNRLYDAISDPDFIENVIDQPIFDGIYLDPELAMTIQNKMKPFGRLGVHIGDFKDGTPYMMEPDKDGTVSAKALVNKFRPYLGFGYGGNLSDDGKWQISAEAGIQIWGGVPKVVTHEGVALNDLDNLRGRVKTYMNLMRCLPVYPSIACRVSYSF